MSNWTPQDWAIFLTAFGTLVTAILSAAAAFLANLAKIKAETAVSGTQAVEHKLDANTAITKTAGTAAAASARVAAQTATEAKVATEAIAKNIDKKLNGGLDVAIESALKPIRDMLENHAVQFDAHALQDEANMREIRASLDSLRKPISK